MYSFQVLKYFHVINDYIVKMNFNLLLTCEYQSLASTSVSV